jgi:hypothetical protein
VGVELKADRFCDEGTPENPDGFPKQLDDAANGEVDGAWNGFVAPLGFAAKGFGLANTEVIVCCAGGLFRSKKLPCGL